MHPILTLMSYGYINGELTKNGRTGGIIISTNNKSTIFMDQSKR
jgi:hypothetical protein